MHGSTMDAMSAAVDNAAAFVFGVSIRYKESGYGRVPICRFCLSRGASAAAPYYCGRGRRLCLRKELDFLMLPFLL